MEELVLSSTLLPISIIRYVILPLAWDSHAEEKLKRWFYGKWTRYLLNRDYRWPSFRFGHLLCVRHCGVCWTKREANRQIQQKEAERQQMRHDPKTPEEVRVKFEIESKQRHQDIIRWVQKSKQKRRNSTCWRNL